MDTRQESSPERNLAPSLRKSALAPLHLEAGDSSTAARRETVDYDARSRRKTIRDSIDKFKPRSASTDISRRSSNDSNSPSRLAKLVPSVPKSKRLKRRGLASNVAVEPDHSSGGQESPHYSPLDGDLELSGIGSGNHPSVESFEANKSVASSLLTSDSDIEEHSVRPTLTSRPSHAGYLTLSSPLIAAESIQPSAPSDLRAADAVESKVSTSSPIPVPEYQSTNPSENALPEESSAIGRTSSSVPVTAKPTLTEKWSDPSRSTPTLVLDDSPALVAIRHAPGPVQSTTEFSSTQSGAPSTVITPPTPELPSSPFPKKEPASSLFKQASSTLERRMSPSSSRSNSPQPDVAVQHRRTKSATAASSRLSTSSLPPLTPVEEVRSPGGGSLAHPPATQGFFSSVFTATQNAVTQISNSFTTNTGGQRSRSGTESTETEKIGPTGGEEVIIPNSSELVAVNGEEEEMKEPAVATLGSGNLSLSHLGITETILEPDTAPSERFVRPPSIVQDSRLYRASEEASAAEAISAAYSDKSNRNKATSGAKDNGISEGKPRSVASGGSLPGDSTPPREQANGYEASLTRRTDSVRSRLSDRRKRRRLSAMGTGTGGAIAAAIGASHSTISNPAAPSSVVQRPPGVAVASSKRNKDFHHFFRSVPDDDYLIEDYSAALQRDILLHGRLYISDRHICFSSNILGWVTNLVMNFDEVVSTEKKSTAVIFPNAIVIQTLHAKNVFASFMNRDATYDLLISIWRTRHPNLKITENGHTLDNSGTPDRLDAAESIDEEDASDVESDDLEDEDDNEADLALNGTAEAGSSAASSDLGEAPRAVSQRVPTGTALPLALTANSVATKPVEGTDQGLPTPITSVDFPGPSTHPPTECSDQTTHYDKQIQDTLIPAPLGKVYSIMFGPSSGVVMRKFLVDDQKSSDLQMEDDKKGIGEETRTFTYSFIKPLSGSIGPKQTKCIVHQTLDAFDLEKAVSVTCSTQTPDVPSGNIFTTKTKYCLMWGPSNSTRLLMSSTVEWSGKSWLKGPIEKGASDGQVQFGKDLATFLKAHVATKLPSKGPKGKVKSKKRKTNDSSMSALPIGEQTRNIPTQAEARSWGLLEPVRSFVEPFTGSFQPIISVTTVMAILLAVVSLALAGQSYRTSSPGGLGVSRAAAFQRRAAYEGLWSHEESELWRWLEDRVSLEAELPPLKRATTKQDEAVMRNAFSAVGEQHMTELQLDEAIRITQERLEALKSTVERKKHRRQGSKSSASDFGGDKH